MVIYDNNKSQGHLQLPANVECDIAFLLVIAAMEGVVELNKYHIFGHLEEWTRLKPQTICCFIGKYHAEREDNSHLMNEALVSYWLSVAVDTYR